MKDIKDFQLLEYNTFGIEGKCKRFVEFDSIDELKSVLATLSDADSPLMVLGGGSNLLLTHDFSGTVLHSNIITPPSVERYADACGDIYVRAGSGMIWDDFVSFCVENGIYGSENLSLIPGTVGASAVQNIGAYGAEAKDVIRRVRFYDVAEDRMRSLGVEECGFGYRESIFKQALKGCVVITEIEIELSREANPRLGYGDVEREVERLGGATLRNIREAICAIRRSKLPDTAVLGNAGSFFKNPIVSQEVAEELLARYPEMPHYATADPAKVKLAAGWLIDRAGLKGYRAGAVGVHEKQALVLVNYGGATGGEVIALARKVQAEVKKQFGVEIDTEVNIW